MHATRMYIYKALTKDHRQNGIRSSSHGGVERQHDERVSEQVSEMRREGKQLWWLGVRSEYKKQPNL